MAELKDLLGESYKEEMTPEEIIAGIKSNDKIVNLTSGNYISKDKFLNLESKYTDANTRLEKVLNETKDMEGLTKQLDEYKKFKTNTEIKEDLSKAGLDPKYNKMGLFLFESGEISNEGDRVKNIQNWLGKNEAYAIPKAPETPEPTKENKSPEETHEKPVIVQTQKLKEEKAKPVKAWNKKLF